jgi:hypothetical protein
LAIVTLCFFFWNNSPRRLDVHVVKIDPNPELELLSGQLDTLELEIAQLSKKAELTDVRQQVVAMIDTYHQW